MLLHTPSPVVEAIIGLIRECELSDRELARRSGVSVQWISLARRGLLGYPRIDILDKVAKYFGKSIVLQ